MDGLAPPKRASSALATRSDSGDDTDIEEVDVDDLIRKGQLAEIGTRA